MTKKTRLPFSSLNIENEKAHIATENKLPNRNVTHHAGSAHPHAGGHHKSGERKKPSKSSTYQYSKGGHGKPQGGNSYGAKNNFKKDFDYSRIFHLEIPTLLGKLSN